MYNYFEHELEPFCFASGSDERSAICEAAEALASDQLLDFGEKQLRSQAMSAVLGWVEEQDYSFDALNAFVIGIADIDGDEEISEDEEALYNALLEEIGSAMIVLGCDEDNVKTFLNEEDDDAGLKVGEFLSEKLDNTEEDDEALVARFTVQGNDAVFEAMVKKVRNGKVVLVRKKVKKVRLSAAQRAALKKARRKAHTGAARLARKKAMKVRKNRGL